MPVYLRDGSAWILFVGCLTSQQHACVSQGRICSDNLTCCHTEIEAVDQTIYLTQLQYTETGPTSPSTDPITPGAWQGSQRTAKCDSPGGSEVPFLVSRTRDLPLGMSHPGVAGCCLPHWRLTCIHMSHPGVAGCCLPHWRLTCIHMSHPGVAGCCLPHCRLTCIHMSHPEVAGCHYLSPTLETYLYTRVTRG